MSEWESLSNDISVHGYTPPKVTNNQLRKERDEALARVADLQARWDAVPAELNAQLAEALARAEKAEVERDHFFKRLNVWQDRAVKAERGLITFAEINAQLAEAEEIADVLNVGVVKTAQAMARAYREKHPKDKA